MQRAPPQKTELHAAAVITRNEYPFNDFAPSKATVVGQWSSRRSLGMGCGAVLTRTE